MSLRGCILLGSAAATVAAIATGLAHGLTWGLLVFCAACVAVLAVFLVNELIDL